MKSFRNLAIPSGILSIRVEADQQKGHFSSINCVMSSISFEYGINPLFIKKEITWKVAHKKVDLFEFHKAIAQFAVHLNWHTVDVLLKIDVIFVSMYSLVAHLVRNQLVEITEITIHSSTHLVSQFSFFSFNLHDNNANWAHFLWPNHMVGVNVTDLCDDRRC